MVNHREITTTEVKEAINILKKRVDKLEGWVKHWNQSIKELLTTPSPIPSEIKAKKYVLTDEKGVTRAAFVVGKDGPAMALYDEEGSYRAFLRFSILEKEGRPKMNFSDKSNNVIWETP